MSKLDQAEAQVRRATVLVLVMGLILVVAMIGQTWLLFSSGGSAIPALMLVISALPLAPLCLALDSQRKLIAALRDALDQRRQPPGTGGGP